MNDQSPTNENPEPFDRREARRQRREERLADPYRGWMAGVILIVLGAIFLLRNTGIFNIPLTNWWALFILIPAIGSLDAAMRIYRHAGNELNAAARGSLFVGLLLLMITGMFLFNISWTLFGPFILILAGIGILVNAMFK